MNDLQKKTETECLRIEEDAEQSAKRHFNAASRWSSYNNWLGIPSITIAAITSAVSFASLPVLGGILAAITGSLTAILTFLKPSERSTAHTTSGNQYLRLRNETRLFREIEMLQTQDRQNLSDKLKAYTLRREELNDGAPITNDDDYIKSNQGIINGQSEYKADKK